MDSSSNDTEASATVASLVYATSQNPFLYSPPSFTSLQVLETLVLPNISLAFLVCYLVPPLGTLVTNITVFGLKPPGPEEPQPTQETVETTPAKEVPIAKPVIMVKKTANRGKNMVTLAIQRESPVCAICDVIGHPTHICQELDELKPLLGSEVDISTPHPIKMNVPPRCVPIAHAISTTTMGTIPTIVQRSHDIEMTYMPLSNPIKRIPPPRHREINLVPSYTCKKNEGL